MRQRVTVQTLTETRDQYGQMQPSWNPAGIYWAEVHNLAGREAVNAKQISAAVTHSVRMRYLGTLFPTPGLLPSMRLIFNGSIYNILWVNDVDNRHKEYQLLVQEVGPPANP
jgi:SPP1 family predicted phage head-tail adaptor